MSIPLADAAGHLQVAVPDSTTRWRQRLADHRDALADQEASKGLRRAPPRRKTAGRFVGLCVLLDFPDRRATITREEVEAFCNQPGYAGFRNRGSVADYFRDASAGKLDYQTVVLPYFTAPETFSFYDEASIHWPDRARSLIAAALNHHKSAGVDFSALTVDDAQAVYAINVFHAGAIGANWSKGMWPHASALTNPVALARGRTAVDYQLSAMGEELTLGVYCHENGHMLCEFPDLYDAKTNRQGVGRYCLMCLGCNADARNPTYVGAYLRWRAGWGDAVAITSGEHRLPPSTTNRFLIHRRSETEYFLIENRRNQGRDAALAASGLAIWHIDELGSNFDAANAPEGHRHAECRLLQADGLQELDEGKDDGDGADLFGDGVSLVFVDDTPRAARWWDRTSAGLQIEAVRVEGEDVVFTATVG